jgi:hypothetical protein
MCNTSGNIYKTRLSANRKWINTYYNNDGGNPSPLPGPKFIWDARVTSSITLDDTAVVEWRDVNQGKILNQNFTPDVSKAPSLIDSLDCPAIDFNGINNYLGTFDLDEESTSFTFIIVCGNFSQNLAEDFGAIFSGFFDSNQIQLYFENDTFVQLQGNTFTLQKAFLPLQALAFRITGGDSVEFWSNGGVGLSSAMDPIGSGLDFFQLGATIGSNYLDGIISWVGYYDTAISDGELDTAFSYLSGVYGITVTPVS